MKKHHFTSDSARIIITLVLTVITLICVSSFSCRLSPEGITILGGTYSCPKLVDFAITGSNTLTMTFSQKVTVSEMKVAGTDITPEDFVTLNTQPDEILITENEDGTFRYVMSFQDGFDCGNSYVLYAVVEDDYGNSLSFSSGFSGYNDTIPTLALSEVRTEYDSKKPRFEFVELYVLEDGNTAGMMVEVYYGSKKNEFIFPAVDVHQGEFLVLHMRTPDESAFNELGDINACTAADSCADARDFWYPSESKTLGSTGVILLRERENGRIADALLYAESSKASWPKDEMKAAAQSALLAGLWEEGSEPSDAVCSDSCTATRTLSRKDYSTVGAAAWIVVAQKGETPGKVNSLKE